MKTLTIVMLLATMGIGALAGEMMKSDTAWLKQNP
jgi:hypothetical protein